MNRLNSIPAVATAARRPTCRAAGPAAWMAASLLAVVTCVADVSLAQTPLSLPAIFGDNMILQRGENTPLWGTADPGQTVRVKVGEVEGSGVADEAGKWRVNLNLASVGTDPVPVAIAAGTQTLAYNNVLVGDVWVASGQSNMEWVVANSNDAEKEIAASANPKIRHFTVTKRVSDTPLDELTGRWEIADPQTTGHFSAVAYFFARSLQPAINQPIGIINSSWGGTPSEAWTSDDGLSPFPEFAKQIEARNAAMADPATAQKEFEKKTAEWEAANLHQDKPDEALAKSFAAPGTDAASWKKMNLPATWESAGLEIDGAVWFRRNVVLPETWLAKSAELSLGPIDDFDTTFVNGVKVGGTGADTAEYWSHPRRYRVPADALRPGRNTIAVRVFDHGGQGGIDGRADQMTLSVDGEEPVSLAGEWAMQVEKELPPLDQDIWSTRPAAPAANANSPGVLFNGMIHPLIPYGIKGAIWYQGESNAWRAAQYRAIFPAMIRDWRKAWGQGDFPFLLVQLANFTPVATSPGDSDWAELREAQMLTLKEPNTGMAVIIDVGNADDIHPRNKQDVGGRLALSARAVAYGQDVLNTGPRFESQEIADGKIRLKFTNVGDGLKTSDGKALRGFAIAAQDRTWRWADATIEGKDTIVVQNEDIKSPIAVRYGWANNPDVNLQDSSGLPASPFRSDDFPLITANNR